MHSDDPGAVGMLAIHALRGTRKSLEAAVRVCPGRSDAKAVAALPHQIRHVKLRSPASLESGEMDVFRRRDDPPARSGRNRDTSWPCPLLYPNVTAAAPCSD